MPPSGPPTEQEIRKIARRTTKIIRSSIIGNVCLFGSAASSLWAGIGRVPNVSRTTRLYPSLFHLKALYSKTQDIDILVSEDSDDDGWPLDPEEIKETIVDEDDRYYLKRSRQRGETHQILYCRLPGWKTDRRRRVKVDILVPPTLGLPEISDMHAIFINDIPVMPIFDLLVMKTQGWWDHHTSIVQTSAPRRATMHWTYTLCWSVRGRKESRTTSRSTNIDTLGSLWTVRAPSRKDLCASTVNTGNGGPSISACESRQGSLVRLDLI